MTTGSLVIDRPGRGDSIRVTTPFVFVSVGTDHHRFDRLIEWMDRWAGMNPAVDCLLQIGSSAEPKTAKWRRFLPFTVMDQATREASVVVLHGGPASIIEARSAGRLPIVVPRRGLLREHVDNHQELFAQRLSERGQISLVRSEEALHAEISRALQDPASFRTRSDEASVSASVERLDQLVSPFIDTAHEARAKMAPS